MKLPIWLASLIVIPAVLFFPTRGDFPSGAHHAIRCMLAHNPEGDCASLPKVIVPSYLLQEFDNAPHYVHEALRNTSLTLLSGDQVSNIPLSLLYLIPRARLADLSVDQLGAILQRHPDDTSLVQQVKACLLHGNKLIKLIEKMNFSLPDKSLQILAESVEVSDLTSDFLKLSFFEKEPLLAYLRPDVLFRIDTSSLYDLFNVLQLSKPPMKSAFYFLTEIEIRHRIPLSKLNGFVIGLSPDKLLNESISFDVSVSDFRLDLSTLQARALFERSYKNESLNRSNFIDSSPILWKLSPELLQKFPENVHKYEVKNIGPVTQISLPTACQITEYVKADCILTGRLPKEEDKFWGVQIRHLGKWVYTLPLSALAGYQSSELNTAVLSTIESPALTPMQAYYLSSEGTAMDVMTPNSVLELETFLHALPASQLVNRKVGEISFHVMLHLVSKLPADNLPRALSLVNKISSSIGDLADVAMEDNGDSSILEELLGNSDVNQLMSLISPKDLALSLDAILKFFSEKKIRDSFRLTIEQLPQQILAALLDHDRMSDPNLWRWGKLLDDSHVSHLLIGGLTCQHIEDMDTGLFISVMSRYNAINKKHFPKNLQHCCLQKLMSYLKLKITLAQADADLGLISFLEPIEIESVGGYILVGIPIDAMRVSPYLGHILSKIGQLSSTELMLSTDINILKQIAELAVDKEGTAKTFSIRNLAWFLPPNTSTPDLRLVLEAELLDTTVCLPAEGRRHLATRLISIFGSPENWSAGVLATMQDLLIVFTDEELGRVSKSSWTEAADSLSSHYGDIVDHIEHSAFYKVCADTLGKSEGEDLLNAIGRYTRWRLKGAQWLLNTVVSISKPETSIPRYIIFEKTTTEQSTTEKSTTEETTTEETTTEESTTETSTTELSTSEGSTSETSSTTEASTTKKTTTEASTTEKIITEKSRPTTERSKTETSAAKSSTTVTSAAKSSTVKTVTEKSIRKDSFNENMIEGNKTEDNGLTKDSQTYQKGSKVDIATQKNTFVKTNKNVTNEVYITEKIEVDKISVINSTTQKPALLNISTTFIKNVSSDTSPSFQISETFYENITDIEIIPSCINSVNKEDCLNTTRTSQNKLNALSTNEINHNDTASQEYPKPTTSVINIISNISNQNQSNYLSFQNSSTVSSKTSYNQSTNLTTDKISTTTPSESKKQNSEMPLPSNTPNNKLSPALSSSNSSGLLENNKTEKIETINEQPQNNYTTNQTTETIVPIEDDTGENEEEEEFLSSHDDNGILIKPDKRDKRGLTFLSNEVQFSCNAIKMIGSLAELALTTTDLIQMSADDVANCRMEFGQMELDMEIQKIIWRIDNKIKMVGVHLLGRLLRAMNVADLWDITFYTSHPWVLETIQAIIQHNNNSMVLKKLREEVVRNNELSVDLLAVLGPEVCSFGTESLQKLSVVGLNLGSSCASCLPYLATRATEELGNVNTWTPHFVHSLQSIVAGLDSENWKQLAESDKKPLSGLQPSAVKCLNITHLEVLSPDQIRMIPAVSLLSLSELQLGALNSTQLETVKNITHPSITEKMTPETTKEVYIAGSPSGGSDNVVPTTLLITFISIINIFMTHYI